MIVYLPYVYLAVCALIVLAALVWWYASDNPNIERGEHRREEDEE
jgi:hypothetical protein